MMICKRLFLETSILEAQTIKVPVVSKVTLETCDHSKVITGASEYSLVEYYNAVVWQVDYLERQLESSNSVKLTSERVARVLGASKFGRREQMCREILHWLEEELVTFDRAFPRAQVEEEQYQDARAEQARMILVGFKKAWVSRLKKLVHYWESNAECYWANQLEKSQALSLRPQKIDCRRSRPQCKVVQFLSDRMSDLNKVQATIKALPSPSMELQRLSAAIDEFRDDPKMAEDYKTGCRKFADLIHVLESDTVDTIYSMNPAEFGPLCKALGKTFLHQDHHGNSPTEIKP